MGKVDEAETMESRAPQKPVDSGGFRDATPFEMVGTSPAYRAMEGRIRKLSEWDECVLIVGERGSGKEMVARALHLWSKRRRRPFVPILLPALTESMLIDELFGHRRGSFTGAEEARLGKFATAEGGTVFLDEIGDMSAGSQAALLRVLETKAITRVGEDLPLNIDVRIISATNKDLQAMIEEGKFRADLYDRLRVLEIRVPPLRERREDIPLLATHFLKGCCAEGRCPVGKPFHDMCFGESAPACATTEFLDGLTSEDWPGNVRELRSRVFRLRAEHQGMILERRHLANVMDESWPKKVGGDADLTLRSATRCHIQRVLDQTRHNVAESARILQIPRSTLRGYIKRLGIRALG